MQYKEENIVCMLCLRSSECAFEDVEGVNNEMLIVLGLDLHMFENGTPVICQTCSESLEQCSAFKKICLHTENCINSFKNDNVKLDLTEIYLTKNENENKHNTAPKYNNICRLCMEIVEADFYTSLIGERKDVVLVQTILRRCFSELDLDITKNPVICTSCNESLQTYFSFIKNHLGFGDDIKQECEIQESSIKPKAELNWDLQTGAGNVSNCNTDGIGVDIQKNELYDETKLKFENLIEPEFQELPIKYEDEHIETYIEVETLNNLSKNHGQEQHGEAEIKHENIVEAKAPEFNIKHEGIDIKTDQDDVAFAHSVQDTRTPIAAYSCGICTYKTKHKGNVKKHMLSHKNCSEITTYSCAICTYIAKRKHNLQQHMLIHKNASEVTTYQCDICLFRTRHKWALKGHLLIHQNASEVATFSCEICTYRAKRRSDLKKHMLIHKVASEVTTYQCDVCTFKTRHKCVLKEHALVHKTASTATIYQCDICTFTTIYKKSLKQHMLTHRNASEVTIHSCGMCIYETKRKRDLQRHILIHKPDSEVKTYQCDVCTFKTRHRKSLKTHLLIHKSESEVTMHSCGTCTYKARRKGDLQRHMLIHKDASEVTMYSCQICMYKAKRKDDVQRHMLTHKKPKKFNYTFYVNR